MSFLGFNAPSHMQQHGPTVSPQRIGTQQQMLSSTSHKPAQDTKPPSAAEQIQRLAQQYREEAARLAEILSLCGIQHQSLSLEAQNSLKLLVQLACALNVTQTTPQVLMAAWSMLLVKQGKAIMWQHKLQCERAALAQKRATAQQKVAVLQKLLSDVTAVQQHQAKHLPAKVSGARQAQEKVAYYQAHIAKAEEQLAKNGFRPEITHSALEEKHSQIQQLQQRLEGVQRQLNKYHELPATLLGARMKLDEAKKQLAEKQKRFKAQLVEDAFL